MGDTGVDYHTQVPVPRTESQTVARLQRSLTMQKRCADRRDWETYDEWAAHSEELRKELGG